MTAETTNPDADPQLRRNSLGLPELVFQGVTHIAPAANIVFTFPIIALKAGPDMPLSFLLSTIVCFFIGNTVSQFSRYMPSSGGYYSFATRGLGSRSGFMATWSYLIYEILGSAGCTGFLGYLISDIFQDAVPREHPMVVFRVGDICPHLGAHSPRHPAVGADYSALRRPRTAHYVGAWDHVPDPSRTRFLVPCAAKAFFLAPSLRRYLGWDGFLHPRA